MPLHILTTRDAKHQQTSQRRKQHLQLMEKYFCFTQLKLQKGLRQ